MQYLKLGPRGHQQRMLAYLRAVAAAVLIHCTVAGNGVYYRYIIVGAGPAGLQLAHYLDSSARSYVVLEKESRAASFFDKYPRLRRLVTVNKENSVNEQTHDWNMRHDEHSLLSEPSHSASGVDAGSAANHAVTPCLGLDPDAYRGYTSTANGTRSTSAPVCMSSHSSSTHPHFLTTSSPASLRLRAWSQEYHPHAEDVGEYLRWWAGSDAPRGEVGTPADVDGVDAAARPSRQPRPLHILTHAGVARVMRPTSYDPTLWSGPSHGRPVGVQEGQRLEEAVEAEVARKRRVSAALAHGTPRFTLILTDGRSLSCTYLVWAGGVELRRDVEGVNITAAAAEGVVHTYANAPTNASSYSGASVLVLGRGNAALELASFAIQHAEVVHLVGRPSGRIREARDSLSLGDVAHAHAGVLERYLLRSPDVDLSERGGAGLSVRRNPVTGRIQVGETTGVCEPDVYGRDAKDCFWRREYDIVISCGGWGMSVGPFDHDVSPPLLPAVAGGTSLPILTPSYESTGVPGLYFAGALAHAGLSRGSYLLGLRYAVRALHRILEEEEQESLARAYAAAQAGTLPSLRVDTVALSHDGRQESAAPSVPASTGTTTVQSSPASSWPRSRLCGVRAVIDGLLRRAHSAAGPFHMPGALVDVLVLPPLSLSGGAVKGYTGVSLVTPLEEPWTFPRVGCPAAHKKEKEDQVEEEGEEEDEEREAVGVTPPLIPCSLSDPSLPPISLYIPYHTCPHWAEVDGKVEHPGVMQAARAANKSEGALDEAVSGWLHEEVPAALVQSKVGGWAVQALAGEGRGREAEALAHTMEQLGYGVAPSPPRSFSIGAGGSTTPSGLAWGEYITFSLEYGSEAVNAGLPEWKKDLVEANSTGQEALAAIAGDVHRDGLSASREQDSVVFPHRSPGRHPVLRYYHTGLSPRNLTLVNGTTVSSAGLPGVQPCVRNALLQLRSHGCVSGSGPGASRPPPRPLPPYSGPLGLPVWECHLKSDAHGDYYSHPTAILPLARCLQDIGARRLEAAQAVIAAAPELVGKAAPRSTLFKRQSGGDMHTRALNATRRVWARVPGAEAGKAALAPSGPHAEEIAAIMRLPHATLWADGHRIGGGAAWWLRVSHVGMARIGAKPLLAVHAFDPLPTPLTEREKAYTAAIAQVQSGAGPYVGLRTRGRAGNGTAGGSGGTSSFTYGNFTATASSLPPWLPPSTAPPWRVAQAAALTLSAGHPRPWMSAANASASAQEEARREVAYARLTRFAPGCVIISLDARCGLERVWAESQVPPLPAIPSFRLRDWKGSLMDLEGNLEKEKVWETFAKAVHEALADLAEGEGQAPSGANGDSLADMPPALRSVIGAGGTGEESKEEDVEDD